ncbi:MAG: GNAT family N-acetyltransferase [Aureispira sp.]|nr:GNAT family N-acetyltransferase [Aureispira sp.]
MFKEYTLKDNSTIIIREGILSDALALNELAMTTFSTAEHVLTTPNEFIPKSTEEAQQLRITEYTIQEGWVLLVAEHDGQLIGNIDFTNGRCVRNQHTGEFGMSVHPDYKNKGVGKHLLAALLDWAKANPLIEKVKLRVFTNNKPAVHLYEKLGFIKEGELHCEVKMETGMYIDLYEMYKMVK